MTTPTFYRFGPLEMYHEGSLYFLVELEDDVYLPVRALETEFEAEEARDELLSLNPDLEVVIVEAVYHQYDQQTPRSVFVVYDPERPACVFSTDQDDLAEDAQSECSEEDRVEYSVQEVDFGPY